MAKKSEKIPVKPEVLRTLRENGGYEIDELAKKLNTTIEKIKKVECGKDYFTIKQIKKLSEIYKVPLAAFFSEEIPHLPSLPDYRVNREKKIPPTVNMAIRRAIYLSETMYDISGKQTIIPKLPQNISPKELAEKLREFLVPNPPNHVDASKILNYYKMLIEEKMNIIIIEYPLKAEDVRAFVLKKPLSVIVLNESDESPVKIFSLFHELGHIIRGREGLCSITMEEDMDEERYCNKFAAEFLMPEEEFVEMVNRYGTEIEKLKKLQRIFGVSIQAMMIRLRNLGLISPKRYKEFKQSFKNIEKKGGGGKNWESTYKNRSGYLVIREVSKAHQRGEISFYEAMRILDVKTKYAEKLIG